MTLSSTETKKIYGGNGSTTGFPIPFMFARDEDIEVTLTDIEGLESPLAISTDYQLTGAGEQNGGTCTTTAPPEAGQTLVIRRNPAIVQEVDYLENDAFPAATHEGALDKLTMICQALSERLDRTITFRVSSAVSGVEIPDPNAGQVLAWNEAGNNLTNKESASVGGDGSVLLPLAIADGGTGGTTLDDALTNLGFGEIGRSVTEAKDTCEAQAAMDAEPADTAIIKADLPDLLQAVFGDEAQVYTGADLSGLTIDRNHIMWTLTEDSQFSDVALPYDGTYVFHIYPDGNALSLAASFKTDGGPTSPDSTAGEIRIVIEQYNTRKTIVSLQNMEA